ncbi:hypothetical protein DICVIV_04414 [Dictyocaulus viviparus]|uniref:Uncharacterized protein n=1 Tax=Dictyocaulus viviparus TaxID=29172 RepID=A0A0D8Y015_DICVI|nr:hypothetical protein DICVIV_04414 [Dictyocaulus viviparus]
MYGITCTLPWIGVWIRSEWDFNITRHSFGPLGSCRSKENDQYLLGSVTCLFESGYEVGYLTLALNRWIVGFAIERGCKNTANEGNKREMRYQSNVRSTLHSILLITLATGHAIAEYHQQLGVLSGREFRFTTKLVQKIQRKRHQRQPK